MERLDDTQYKWIDWFHRKTHALHGESNIRYLNSFFGRIIKERRYRRSEEEMLNSLVINYKAEYLNSLIEIKRSFDSWHEAPCDNPRHYTNRDIVFFQKQGIIFGKDSDNWWY